jgi:hypothetical protein
LPAAKMAPSSRSRMLKICMWSCSPRTTATRSSR